MVQWCQIKLESGIFWIEFEVIIILKEMLIKHKTRNKGRMVFMCEHQGHAFLPMCCYTYFLHIQSYKHSNCIWVPETPGSNILIMQGGTFHIFGEGSSGDYGSKQS